MDSDKGGRFWDRRRDSTNAAGKMHETRGTNGEKYHFAPTPLCPSFKFK